MVAERWRFEVGDMVREDVGPFYGHFAEIVDADAQYALTDFGLRYRQSTGAGDPPYLGCDNHHIRRPTEDERGKVEEVRTHDVVARWRYQHPWQRPAAEYDEQTRQHPEGSDVRKSLEESRRCNVLPDVEIMREYSRRTLAQFEARGGHGYARIKRATNGDDSQKGG